MLTRSRSHSREGSEAISDSQSSSGYSSSLSQSQSQEDSAPKEEYVPKKKKARGRGPPVQPDQWICLMPDKVCTASNRDDISAQSAPSFVTLRDPRAGCSRRYLWRPASEMNISGDLCEILKFIDEPRSWFVDNSIQTDGSLFMCTPVDPLFTALPYLIKASESGKFTTLEAILEDPDYNSYHILSNCVQRNQWQHVCDFKSISDEMTVYKFSKEKAISWLRAKVAAQASSLEKKGVYVGTGSQSSMLVRSNKRSDISKSDYVKYACGMVCEYLPKELATELEDSYSEELKLEGEGEPPAKRPHLEQKHGLAAVSTTAAVCDGSTIPEPLEDYTKIGPLPPPTKPVKVDSKLSANQRKLAKVDKTGMKSITSFFAPKNKK